MTMEPATRAQRGMIDRLLKENMDCKSHKVKAGKGGVVTLFVRTLRNTTLCYTLADTGQVVEQAHRAS
jgi:hypothetical protein